MKPYTIYNGTKLMLLEVESLGLKVIDSSNFVQGALSSFPKTFWLKELNKVYFPHIFNTKVNIPSTSHYYADSMKPKERKDFLK